MSDTKTVISTEVELQPFRVPNYVLIASPPKPREQGFTETPKYHLSELSTETLEALCEQFRRDVLAKGSGDTPNVSCDTASVAEGG